MSFSERLDWTVSTATLPTPRTVSFFFILFHLTYLLQSHTCTLYGASIVLIGGDAISADVNFLDVGKFI